MNKAAVAIALDENNGDHMDGVLEQEEHLGMTDGEWQEYLAFLGDDITSISKTLVSQMQAIPLPPNASKCLELPLELPEAF